MVQTFISKSLPKFSTWAGNYVPERQSFSSHHLSCRLKKTAMPSDIRHAGNIFGHVVICAKGRLCCALNEYINTSADLHKNLPENWCLFPHLDNQSGNAATTVNFHTCESTLKSCQLYNGDEHHSRWKSACNQTVQRSSEKEVRKEEPDTACVQQLSDVISVWNCGTVDIFFTHP